MHSLQHKLTISGQVAMEPSKSRIVHRVTSSNVPITARRSDPRTGLNQLLEMKSLVMDTEEPSSSSSILHQSQVDSPVSGQNPWCLPQLGAAVPALNEVSLALAERASNFRRQIAGFVEETVAGDARVQAGSASSSEGMTPVFSSTENEQRTEGQQANVTLPSAREPLDPASENSSILGNFGGAVSLFNATSAAMLGMSQSLMSGPPAVWQGLVARVQTTLRGSADDIGWLLKDPTLPPVEDRTERFVQLLGRISNGVHVLPDNLVYLLVPGLFSNHGPLYFVDTKKYFSRLGLSCHIARIHSEAAVETNARELKEYIEELYWGTGKRVVLLGHSKGGVDAAAALSMFWPELKDKVVGLVLAQSPYGGSPVASDILREGQIADFETRRILEVVITKIIKGDMRSLEDLTYEKRREFLAKNPLPSELLTVSFHTEASRAASVLSTMSHIAHAELPWLPGTSGTSTSEEPAAGAKLPVVIPLAAAMALCALHLDLRYGEKSDGLVARKDAEVPGSLVVRPDKKLDHAWMVYSPSRKDAKDPDSSQMCEALLTLLLEEETMRKAGTSKGEKQALEEMIATDESGFASVKPAEEEIEVGNDYLEKL
ncbi:hypothetical protein AXG93_4278s1100 [Marchantia polymorpha subsp. ruderalis]|uniref:GPI inositol-deacylase n=3 Tax=Marchantia polymorpha TaxID=3197 RepID=A0A176W3C1_MARPO|nr:hypothetical protein AXG93_4278s1100 [Marchantia polymorpha subsp. ruderalis]